MSPLHEGPSNKLLEWTGRHQFSSMSFQNHCLPLRGKRYSNAHNAEAGVALCERAEDGLRCCHGFALNKSELCIRLLLVVFDHGMVPLIFFFCAVRQKREHRAMSRCWRLESP